MGDAPRETCSVCGYAVEYITVGGQQIGICTYAISAMAYGDAYAAMSGSNHLRASLRSLRQNLTDEYVMAAGRNRHTYG